MSRRKKFVEQLSEAEILTLDQGYKYGRSVDFRQRCHMLLLSNQGYEVKQIVDVLKVCPQTIYSVLKAWEKQGLSGLIRKQGQGRTAKLQVDNAHHVEVVKKAVEKHSQSSDLILEELYAELDIEPMSKRSLRRFLKKVATAGSDSANG
jgi:transposase